VWPVEPAAMPEPQLDSQVSPAYSPPSFFIHKPLWCVLQTPFHQVQVWVEVWQAILRSFNLADSHQLITPSVLISFPATDMIKKIINNGCNIVIQNIQCPMCMPPFFSMKLNIFLVSYYSAFKSLPLTTLH
jgi:hypothetical protein